jgi:protein subunit release factor B
MSRFKVTQEKERALLARMEELGIEEDLLLEKFIKGSGSGGQKINKTSSCVYLFHEPSGIEIKCQKTRSQALNRYHARQLLCDALEERILGEKSKKEMEREKIRRQKRKRSKRAQEKILKDKKIQGEKKRSRNGLDDE